MNNNLSAIKGNKIGKLLYYLFVYEFMCCFLVTNLSLPNSIMFGVDVFYIILLVASFRAPRVKGYFLPEIILAVLILSTLVGMVLNQSEISNYIWGARSEFLGMVLLFAGAQYLTLADIERIFKFCFKFQFLNLACAAYQYHVLGYYQDLNNGAFVGGAFQDVFCAALFAYYFYKYVRHEDKLWKVIFIAISTLYIAVVEEEKFLFIEMAGIVAYYFISTRMNFSKVLIIIGCFIAASIALPLLNSVNGQDSMEMLTSWEKFEGYVTMVGYGYELPRIGSSVLISAKFFATPIQELFGLGLGMCEDASTIAFINTAFYSQFSWLHYMWFTFQIQFMQTGWVGIILYILFFVSLLYANLSLRTKMPDNYKYLSDFSIAIVFICIALIWYSSSLRGYAGNMPYFCISIGAAVYRQLSTRSTIKAK